MKTLLVVKFNNPIIFYRELNNGRGWRLWNIGLLVGEHTFSTPGNIKRYVVYWDYHKRPNLGWWKRVKRRRFNKTATVIGQEASYSQVIATWNVPDSLYDEILSWCIDEITAIYSDLFSRKTNNSL